MAMFTVNNYRVGSLTIRAGVYNGEPHLVAKDLHCYIGRASMGMLSMANFCYNVSAENKDWTGIQGTLGNWLVLNLAGVEEILQAREDANERLSAFLEEFKGFETTEQNKEKSVLTSMEEKQDTVIELLKQLVQQAA